MGFSLCGGQEILSRVSSQLNGSAIQNIDHQIGSRPHVADLDFLAHVRPLLADGEVGQTRDPMLQASSQECSGIRSQG